jgi:hypothetical protein
MQTSLEIPDGYVVSTLPADRKFNNGHFGFTVSYNQLGRSITMKREIWVDTLLLPMSQFVEWNKMVDALTLSYKELVLLNKVNRK